MLVEDASPAPVVNAPVQPAPMPVVEPVGAPEPVQPTAAEAAVVETPANVPPAVGTPAHLDPAVQTAQAAPETAPAIEQQPTVPVVAPDPVAAPTPEPAASAAPVAAAPIVPTLPSAAAVASVPAAATTSNPGMSAERVAAIEAQQRATATRVKARQIPQHSIGARIVRTGFAALLVAGIGVGARFGYDYYEHGRPGQSAETGAESATGGFLPPVGGGLPIAEPATVSGKYIDATIVATSADQTVTETSRLRYSLQSSNLTLDFTGAAEGYLLDVRDGKVHVRPDGQGNWVDVTGDANFSAIPASFGRFIGFVPVFHDMVPVEAIPFVTVTSEAEEQLNVIPLDPPVAPEVEEAADVAVAGNVDPQLQDVVDRTAPVTTAAPAARPSGPVSVRHYTLSIDESAFAAAEPLVHANWSADGYPGDTNIDIWVDDLGVVRQFRDVNEWGDTVTVTFSDVAADLPNFQTESIVSTPTVDPGE